MKIDSNSTCRVIYSEDECKQFKEEISSIKELFHHSCEVAINNIYNGRKFYFTPPGERETELKHAPQNNGPFLYLFFQYKIIY